MLMGILETSQLLRQRSISPVQLTEECLARIDSLNPLLNAFITVTAASAITEARRAELEIRNGCWRGPLHGIPIALKDIIDTAGTRTTAASALFKDRVPLEDAEVVRRLNLAGAVLLGKQNLHEFAYGGSSLVSYFGEVRNPWNPLYITGGSSGGSAAGVAAGMCYAAVGTDTAGSVREPASQCGVVGLKPTYGRVSARGVIPLSWSLDHVGPIAGSVADVAVLLQAMAGYDAADPASVDAPVNDYVAALTQPVQNLRIGIPRPYFFADLDSEVSRAVDRALAVLGNMTTDVREISLEVDSDRSLQSAESYAYHADSVARSPELYQPETLRRIRAGERVCQEDRARLQRKLAESRQTAVRIFQEVDLLVTPTVPILSPTIAELKQKPEQLRPTELLLLRNTRPFNVWGFPAISVPCGFTAAGLPIGLQIAGPHWGEAAVLSLAHAYEKATSWHERKPALPIG
jgi:aspartyl-tRNA(Asn)/glutamyl-tRNA(Gln) amidotransferase subunit A